MDLICLSEEPAPKVGEPLNYHPLGLDEAARTTTPARVTSLRLNVFSHGEVIFTYSTLQVNGSIRTVSKNWFTFPLLQKQGF